MKYVTITANSYEDALRKAEQEYGSNNIRIHSRRDYTVGGGLFSKKRNKCDLTLYIAQGDGRKGKVNDDESILEFEKEARTPDPDSLTSSERLDTEVYRGSLEKVSKAEKILKANDITEPLWSVIMRERERNIPGPEDRWSWFIMRLFRQRKRPCGGSGRSKECPGKISSC